MFQSNHIGQALKSGYSAAKWIHHNMVIRFQMRNEVLKRQLISAIFNHAAPPPPQSKTQQKYTV